MIRFPDAECEIDGFSIEFDVIVADEYASGFYRFSGVESGVQAPGGFSTDGNGGVDGRLDGEVPGEFGEDLRRSCRIAPEDEDLRHRLGSGISCRNRVEERNPLLGVAVYHHRHLIRLEDPRVNPRFTADIDGVRIISD